MPKCMLEEIFQSRTICHKAKNRLEQRGVRGEKLDEEICPWHIDSEEHLHCFWVYLLDVEKCKEHQLTEIARLLRTSVNNIKLIETGAFEKLSIQLKHLKKQ